LTFRTYRELPGADASGVASQLDAQRLRLRRRLGSVQRVIAVMSGKGGVGKSFVTAALARLAVARWGDGGKVGVVDADLRSPTVARLLGVTVDEIGPLRVTDDGVEPAVTSAGIKVMSTEFLLDSGRPLAWREPSGEEFVWRGALESAVLREFLADVRWGALEVLLVDLPPGSDGVADLRVLVPDLTGALAVTVPTEEARQSVSRAVRAAMEAGIRILGVVENMVGYRCGACEQLGPLFEGNAGSSLASEFGIPLLARLPFYAGGQGPDAGFDRKAATRMSEVWG